jgi:ribosomal protein L37AE/L43A
MRGATLDTCGKPKSTFKFTLRSSRWAIFLNAFKQDYVYTRKRVDGGLCVEMVMLFKSCPKCRGDLFLDRDHYGIYLQCFQCGMTLEQSAETMARRLNEARAKRKAA